MEQGEPDSKSENPTNSEQGESPTTTEEYRSDPKFADILKNAIMPDGQDVWWLATNIESSMEKASRSVRIFQDLFTPHENRRPGDNEHSWKEAQEQVVLLQTEQTEHPEEAVEKFVRLSTHLGAAKNLPDGTDVVDARCKAAEEVVVIIDKAIEQHKFDGKNPYLYPQISPSSSEEERVLRAMALSGIMSASMLQSYNGDTGEELARWHNKNVPDKMGVRYTPSVVVAYGEAAKIVDSRRASPETAEKISFVLTNVVKNIMRYQ